MLAPLGTVTPTLVAFQQVTVADVPLHVTVLDPGVEPKFEPEIVTAVPTGPKKFGVRLVIVSVGNTPVPSPPGVRRLVPHCRQAAQNVG